MMITIISDFCQAKLIQSDMVLYFRDINNLYYSEVVTKFKSEFLSKHEITRALKMQS